MSVNCDVIAPNSVFSKIKSYLKKPGLGLTTGRALLTIAKAEAKLIILEVIRYMIQILADLEIPILDECILPAIQCIRRFPDCKELLIKSFTYEYISTIEKPT